MPQVEIKPIDRAFYEERLNGWLPSRIVDIHTHVWLKSFLRPTSARRRGASWPDRVAEESPVEELLRTFELLFPGRVVMPVIFGSPRPEVDLEPANGYVARSAREYGLPALLLTRPEWSAAELERRVHEGGFAGLKPYLSFAPSHLSADEIAIFDFLPRHHLQVADAHGWVVVLHIPRGGRLRDPLNLEQLLEVEQRYPGVRLVVAHVGRAYCPEDVGNAFAVLGATERMAFDFSANTNAWVIERLLRAVGPKRVLFGSDLPITRMRMRRVCEEGRYVNLVPPGLYGDLQGDPHMREVSEDEGERLSFFLYEELLAFHRAAQAVGLSDDDIRDVFYNNALRLLGDGSFYKE